jgi:hypothetical protein
MQLGIHIMMFLLKISTPTDLFWPLKFDSLWPMDINNFAVCKIGQTQISGGWLGINYRLASFSTWKISPGLQNCNWVSLEMCCIWEIWTPIHERKFQEHSVEIEYPLCSWLNISFLHCFLDRLSDYVFYLLESGTNTGDCTEERDHLWEEKNQPGHWWDICK